MNFIFSGIYSDKFSNSYNSIVKQVNSINEYNCSVMYKKLDQEYFSRKLSTGKCHWCSNNDCRFIFHWGDTCKIQHIIDLIKKYINQNTIIIYTDCDIKLNNNINELLKISIEVLKEKHIVFQEESSNGANKRWKSNINIGWNMFYPTEQVLSFFEEILKIMNSNKHPHNWDQQVVNNIFYHKQTNLKYTLIPCNKYFTHHHH